MTTADLIYQQTPQQAATDMSELDQFGAVYDGTFDRNACYDRPVM